MPKFDFSIYAKILRVKTAWCFDIGTLLMRMYGYMFTIGTVSMLTLAGYSAFIGGTVAATLAIASFFIGPRIGNLIDRKGQSIIVPAAAAISLCGDLLLVLAVLFSLPLWTCYIAAILMGCMPAAQALARTRWTYLIRTGKGGAGALDIRSAYSYEGILEDAGFTLSPAINVGLAAAIHPVAGMLFGAACLVVGTIVLSCAKESCPTVGWEAASADDNCDGGARTDSADAAKIARFSAPDSPWVQHSNYSVFRLSSTIRILFCSMFGIGFLFGSFDTTVVVFCQDMGQATFASPLMAISGVISLFAGMFFGMMKLKSPLSRVLLVTATLYGLYILSVFSFNTTSLLIFTIIASPFYAPFFITLNTACESAVPSQRLTEGIMWMNAGITLGFALGPTMAGLIIDSLGSRYGFFLVALAAIIGPAAILLGRKILSRNLD